MKKPHAMLVAVVAALAVSSTPGISQQVSHAPVLLWFELNEYASRNFPFCHGLCIV